MIGRKQKITRQEFTTRVTVAAASMLGAPAFLRGRNLNDRLNIAIIGAGGRGAANAQSLSSQNLVALCDVHEASLDKAAVLYPQAKSSLTFENCTTMPTSLTRSL